MSVVKMKPRKYKCRCGKTLESANRMGEYIITLQHIRAAHPEAKQLIDALIEQRRAVEEAVVNFYGNMGEYKDGFVNTTKGVRQ